jgi:hypothetical protein
VLVFLRPDEILALSDRIAVMFRARSSILYRHGRSEAPGPLMAGPSLLVILRSHSVRKRSTGVLVL